MTHVEARNVAKSFSGVAALRGVSLTIRAGEFYGLLGPNGAGKTTFLRILCGLVRPDSGDIVFGIDGPLQKRPLWIGVVPQEIALYDELTAEQNLNMFGELVGLTARALKLRVSQLLDSVGLVDRAKSQVKSFSGGMKRRLNLAVGLLHDPPILLLDEPTVGVDPQSRAKIFALLSELHASGKTIIYTTHYMEEVERLCQRIGILDRGLLLAEGTLDQLLAGLKLPRRLRLFHESPLPALHEPELLESRNGTGFTDLIPKEPEGIPTLIACIERQGIRYQRMEIIAPNLEALFLELTGKELRD